MRAKSKKNTLSTLKEHTVTVDFDAIRSFVFSLDEEARQALLWDTTHIYEGKLFPDLKDKTSGMMRKAHRAAVFYARLCCCRNKKDLLADKRDTEWNSFDRADHRYLSAGPTAPYLTLLETPQGAFLKACPPKILPTLIPIICAWQLYQHGIVPFDRTAFQHATQIALCNERENIDEIVHFFQSTPEALHSVLHTLPETDPETVFFTTDWDPLFQALQRADAFTDRSIVIRFLEALLMPFKQNELFFFCRQLRTLAPGKQEVLDNLPQVLSLFGSPNATVVKLAVDLLKAVKTEKALDCRAVCDMMPLVFANERCAKSSLTLLTFIDEWCRKEMLHYPEFAATIATLFLLPSQELHNKAALLLKTRFDTPETNLPHLLEPYKEHMGQDALQTLGIVREAHTAYEAQSLYEPYPVEPVEIPQTVDELLNTLGEAVTGTDPLPLEQFYAGFRLLKGRFPHNLRELLEPFLKKMYEQFDLSNDRFHLEKFLEKLLDLPAANRWWLRDTKGGSAYEFKARLLLAPDSVASRQPFLSTPTHTPFYVEGKVLLERLLQYEEAGDKPHPHDLSLAIARLLPGFDNAQNARLAAQLKGSYAPELRYCFGADAHFMPHNRRPFFRKLTDTLSPDAKNARLFRRLTILRLKHPLTIPPTGDSELDELLTRLTPPADLFRIEEQKVEWKTLRCIVLNGCRSGKDHAIITAGNNSYVDDFGLNPFFSHHPTRNDVPALLACAPHNLHNLILYFVRKTGSGANAESLHIQQAAAETLLRYRLPLQGCALLFVASALLSERRETRDIAADYVGFLAQENIPLAPLYRYLAQLLAERYAPVARFTEFVARKVPFRPLIEAKLGMVQACKEMFAQGSMPVGGKKLLAWETDLQAFLA